MTLVEFKAVEKYYGDYHALQNINLRFEKGVKDIKTDIEAQKVYVSYDPKKTTEEKLQKAFEKFGYKAEKTDKDAKIPVHGDEQCENM